MTNKNFISYKKNINNPNVFLENEMSDTILEIEKSRHKLDNEKILFLWRSKLGNSSLIITDNSISQFDKEELTRKIYFREITRVYFSPDSFFYLYGLNDNRLHRFHEEYFGIEDKKQDYTINRSEFRLAFEDLLNSYRASKIQQKLSINDSAYEELIEKIEKYPIHDCDQTTGQQNANSIIELYDKFQSQYGKGIIYFELENYVISSLSILKQFDKALEKVTYIIRNHSDENLFGIDYWYSLRGFIHCENNNFYAGQMDFLNAKNYSDTVVEENEYSLLHEEAKKEYYKTFLDRDIHKRKFIVISDYLDESSDSPIIILEKDNLPSKLTFPVGHPISSELYMANPFNSESYIPLSESEELLFIAKIQEFLYFTECLGVRKTSIKFVKTSNQKESSARELEGNVKVGNKKLSGELSIKNNKNLELLDEIAATYEYGQQSNPKKFPYLPSDLHYYKHEPSWIYLFKRRLNGNILSTVEKISTNSFHSVVEKDNTNLRLAFKNFLIDSNIDINIKFEKTFERCENFQFEFKLDFEPIENLLKDEENVLSEHFEYNYFLEVVEMLSDDGVIDLKEKRILSKYKEIYNLTEEKAVIIENFSQEYLLYTESEKEYLTEYFELRKYGHIGEKELGTLERLCTRLNIEKKRINELIERVQIIKF